jgi:hypothetical protein
VEKTLVIRISVMWLVLAILTGLFLSQDGLTLAYFLSRAWAHRLAAGPPVPSPSDYTLLEEVRGFDTVTNSRTVLLWSNRLVAAYALEGIVKFSTYPRVVAIMNFDDEAHFIVLGRAAPAYGVIGLSERMLDPQEGDARELLFALAHEIGHLQHPSFFLDPEGMEGRSETLTQIAALEVLAGQCHLGWKLACQATHLELYSLYRAGVADWVERHFPLWAKPYVMAALLGEDSERIEKWDRFWLPHWEDRMDIRRKYAIDPLLFLEHQGCREKRLVDPYFQLEFPLDDLCGLR